MITYFIIALVLFFIGGVLTIINDSDEFGFVFIAALLWPISLLFLVMLITGVTIKKVFNL